MAPMDRALAAKELRVLLPVWGAATVTVAVGGLTAPDAPHTSLLMPLAFLAFTVGTGALGALATGHDYLFGTLAATLSLPVSRRRALLVKMAVFVPLALLLALTFAWALARVPAPSTPYGAFGRLLMAVPLCALCLAPWLTIATRNLIAGTLFPLAIASGLFLAADGVTIYGYGQSSGPAYDALRTAIFRWSIAVACAAGTVVSWRAFMRLEATEGPVGTIDFTTWWRSERLPAAASRREAGLGQRVWLLIVKELHIQQLPFTLAGLALVAWAGLGILYKRPAAMTDVPGVLLPIYFGCLALLVGTQSIADERQMSMLEAQALLPMQMWHQWLVKMTVTVLVGLLLAWALPLALFSASAGLAVEFLFGPLLWAAIAVIAFGMYVSSLSSSGVRAIAYALPAGIAANWYLQSTIRVVIARLPPKWHHGRIDATAAVALGLAAALFWLAYRNYRTMERSPARIAIQAAGLAVFVGVWMLGCALL